MKEDLIEVDGEILEDMSNGMFKIKLDEIPGFVIGYLGGKLRRYNIRVVAGDKVQVELSKYDLKRGRIVWRYK